MTVIKDVSCFKNSTDYDEMLTICRKSPPGGNLGNPPAGLQLSSCHSEYFLASYLAKQKGCPTVNSLDLKINKYSKWQQGAAYWKLGRDIDGYVCENGNQRLLFIVCQPRKTKFRFPSVSNFRLQQINGFRIYICEQTVQGLRKIAWAFVFRLQQTNGNCQFPLFIYIRKMEMTKNGNFCLFAANWNIHIYMLPFQTKNGSLGNFP